MWPLKSIGIARRQERSDIARADRPRSGRACYDVGSASSETGAMLARGGGLTSAQLVAGNVSKHGARMADWNSRRQ